MQLYYGRSRTYGIAKKDGDLHAKIAYTPGNIVEARLLLNDMNKTLIEEALDGKYELGGALLLKKGNEWLLYVAIRKNVSLPRWEDCETIIGVDVGMRNLAYAVTYDTLNKRFYGESFSAKGNCYNHVVRTYKRKLAEVESKCGKESKHYQEANAKYNRMRNEIFHTVSKRTVQYAQRFRKPLIAVEDLSKLGNDGMTKSQRYRLSMWARKRIHQYIAYKAIWEGIPYFGRSTSHKRNLQQMWRSRREERMAVQMPMLRIHRLRGRECIEELALKAWKAYERVHRSPRRLAIGWQGRLP